MTSHYVVSKVKSISISTTWLLLHIRKFYILHIWLENSHLHTKMGGFGGSDPLNVNLCHRDPKRH